MIDAHVHFTPPQLKQELVEYGEPYLEMLLLGEGSIQDWVSAETMIHAMDQAGIDQVVLVGEYYQQHENCVRRNDQVLDVINRFPERISAFAIVQPNAGQAAISELARCLDAGMIGLGELNPYAQHFDLTGTHMLRLADFCASRGTPINFHVGEPVGRYYTGKSCTPLHQYYQLACQFPALKLIFAHWGGGLLFYELMPRVRKQLSHVCYDTAASPLLYPTKRIFEAAMSCVSAEKIIYGSDYPLRLYSGKQDSADFRPFIDAIKQINLDASDAAGIFGGNFKNLLVKAIEPQQQSSADFSAESTESADSALVKTMSLAQIVQIWPETEAIFGRSKLALPQERGPFWEPITQAMAAQGLSTRQQNDLIDLIVAQILQP